MRPNHQDCAFCGGWRNKTVHALRNPSICPGDPGAATDVDLVINRMKAKAKADRWGRGSESVGLTLIVVDVSRSGSFAWQIAGQRVKLAQVRALLEEAAAKGELPTEAPRKG